MTDENEFNVVQFFEDNTYEFVRRNVSAKEAVTAAKHYTQSVAVGLGLISKVIITDGGDFTVFQWEPDKGVVFPPAPETAQ